MVNSYRRSDGPEGAHTCQKIFSHPLSLYGGETAFSGCLALYMRHWFIFIEPSKQVGGSFFHVWIWEMMTPGAEAALSGVKVAPNGGEGAGRSRCPRAQHHSGTGARIYTEPASLISFPHRLQLCSADLVPRVSVLTERWEAESSRFH